MARGVTLEEALGMVKGLADLGPAPSAEEIDQTRREEWANFG